MDASSPIAIDRLFATPDRHLFAFEGDKAVFVPVDRAVYQRSIFLDDRIALGGVQAGAIPVEMLTYQAAPAPCRSPGWIFHVAQCGSTLLARALDLADATLVLREPLALRQLGTAAASGARDSLWEARLRLAASLYGRRFQSGAPAIVKANVPVNFMLPELLALAPQGPAIFLYLPLEAYLRAVLRTDGHRGWVERITAELRPAIEVHTGPLVGLATPERAAALWLAQMRMFLAAVAGGAHRRTLDAATLFTRPGEVLKAAFVLFGAVVNDATVDAIVSGPMFATHAKQPAISFNEEARRAREDSTAIRLRPEILRACAWIQQHTAWSPLPARLPCALVPGQPGRTLLETA